MFVWCSIRVFVLYRWLHDSTVDDYCYLNEMILAVQCSFSLSSILCAHTHMRKPWMQMHMYILIHKHIYISLHMLQHIPYSNKTLAVKKLWRIWWITAFRQAFLPIFTTSITFPMKMDLNLPKFFLPNCLQSLSPKFFMVRYTHLHPYIHTYALTLQL